MLGDISKAEQIYIACGFTDMRKSIDGLAGVVQQNFKMNPFQNSLFLFCGRRKDRIKAIYWEKDGFVLLYKRLESGNFQFLKGCQLINQKQLKLWKSLKFYRTKNLENSITFEVFCC